ncbi:hypothetical protein PHYSODRAFT_288436 [Phytophthora sojae]|uniref:RxLR effector protein n=2 Tax=Phytophthora sojae TaxID=67593 RepID=G5A466_PHYSP|nr:hypothetical protein PHYSODRAFT_288436 [Phytophthora sojae]AEK80675.1 Avh108 [Phytophthora sojae]AEK80676.1 Avh108 [Phytophthora sojae]AEK80677.1 Avh108 [Phytophthora sojae]EGZ09512.1 hypothetical protein PHYSODRAFT_288436 [Phytophthora sojae]|eukprot:XP_009534373.1 hypothetical protein PHYSODRAFT_288436 [Phytophthora sojae]
MRLSCVVLVAVAALVGTLRGTSAATDGQLFKPVTMNAVESRRNDRRALMTHQGSTYEDEEERGWKETLTANLIFAKLSLSSFDT